MQTLELGDRVNNWCCCYPLCMPAQPLHVKQLQRCAAGHCHGTPEQITDTVSARMGARPHLDRFAAAVAASPPPASAAVSVGFSVSTALFHLATSCDAGLCSDSAGLLRRRATCRRRTRIDRVGHLVEPGALLHIQMPCSGRGLQSVEGGALGKDMCCTLLIRAERSPSFRCQPL